MAADSSIVRETETTHFTLKSFISESLTTTGFG